MLLTSILNKDTILMLSIYLKLFTLKIYLNKPYRKTLKFKQASVNIQLKKEVWE